MNESDIKAYVMELVTPIFQEFKVVLQSADRRTEILETRAHRLSSEIDSRLLVMEQELVERQAVLRNAMALNDARFAALMAYVSGGDVSGAFVLFREKFRDAYPAQFDEQLWNVEPEWLAALRQARR